MFREFKQNASLEKHGFSVVITTNILQDKILLNLKQLVRKK
jgi:hypothetical protein